MLGVKGVAPPSTPPVAPMRVSGATNASSFSLPLQNQNQKRNLSLIPLPNCTQLFTGRSGFRLFAQKKKKQGSRLGRIELEKEADFVEDEGFEFDDEFGDEFEDFDEEDEEDDGDNVDDLMVPFAQMKAWLKNKPRGFGEGKVYDTSIEDKLLEEIELSRKAQLANLNKLKDEPTKEAKPNKVLKEASEVVSSEIRVRINNLPKKRNVQRDLKAAFQGFRGIVNISPAVSGNKKTREPVCKGFGFVDFRSLEDADSFVQMFSDQNIAFGKVQKLIRCEILKSCNDGPERSLKHEQSRLSEPRSAALTDKVDEAPDIEEDEPLLPFGEEDEFDEDLDEFDEDDIELSVASEQFDNDVIESELEPELESLSPKQKEKAKGEQKKSVTSAKQDKIPQLSIPGSAMKLKVRERAELSEVFSRYGGKKALDSKETSVACKDCEDQYPDIEDSDLRSQFWEDEDFDEDYEDDLDDEDDSKFSRASVQNNDDITKSKNKAVSDSSSPPKQLEKGKAAKKRSVVKEKASKITKPKVPGSAKRLKGRDQAKLADVFSKYGVKGALASKEM